MRSKLNIVAMLIVFKNVIQYESSKICNYSFSSVKEVTINLINKAKNLILAKFSSVTNDEKKCYKYNHRNGKVSFIDLDAKSCTCTQMFDYGICEHLVRVAIIEEISLPGKYFISF